jgi:hypothetical protein
MPRLPALLCCRHACVSACAAAAPCAVAAAVRLPGLEEGGLLQGPHLSLHGYICALCSLTHNHPCLAAPSLILCFPPSLLSFTYSAGKPPFRGPPHSTQGALPVVSIMPPLCTLSVTEHPPPPLPPCSEMDAILTHSPGLLKRTVTETRPLTGRTMRLKLVGGCAVVGMGWGRGVDDDGRGKVCARVFVVWLWVVVVMVVPRCRALKGGWCLGLGLGGGGMTLRPRACARAPARPPTPLPGSPAPSFGPAKQPVPACRPSPLVPPAARQTEWLLCTALESSCLICVAGGDRCQRCEFGGDAVRHE